MNYIKTVHWLSEHYKNATETEKNMIQEIMRCVEKQNPMDVVYRDREQMDIECPVCGRDIDKDFSYCPDCGQALK